METSISLLNSGNSNGYDIGHKPFWVLVLEQWEASTDGTLRPAVLHRDWTAEKMPDFHEGKEILFAGDEKRSQYILCRDEEGRLYSFSFHDYSHNFEFQLYSPLGMADAEQIRDHYAKLVPPMEDKGEHLINIAFWSLAPNGSATYHDRHIEASKWEDVRLNYPSSDSRNRSVRESLESMHNWKQPPDARGRLLLMHGPAGTGKTNALASLARSWKEWCSVHYVVDPDNFFASAHYMMSVLMNAGDASPSSQEVTKWRLIIVEDADELLSADAKQRKGQDVSRLLNLCDGLVGQGMKVLVLITTNEEVGKMHPAIIRPGRCLANLSIGALSAEDSDTWRREHGLKPWSDATAAGGRRPGQSGSATLAELYEELTQQQVVAGNTGRKPIGF